MIGTVFLRPLPEAASTTRPTAWPAPERLQRRTRGFAAWAAMSADRVLERAMREEAAQAARINRVFDDSRRAADCP